MKKQIITFSANEQTLTKTGGVDCYASNTVAYIEARFDLGDNWSGYDSVRAVWWNDYNKTVATVLDSDGSCIVPYEVLTRKSAVKVNLVGSIADGDVLTDRLTTCPVVALTIKCNAKTDGDNTQPITPSQYEQFVANVKADADRAEAGATASAQSAQSSSESATASANSATSSAQSATASEGYAQNASESAISAENAKDDAESARDKILSMRATASTLPAGSDATASYSDGLLSLGIPKGDTGATGAKGDKGDTGATPDLTIGTVSTLEPNTDATATITGTAENPVLNLGIPKGVQGDVNLSQLEALLPTETASGEIVTITDGQAVVPAKSLKVALEPIQSLNGYDKPWSGGNGKNKLQVTAETQTISGVTFTVHDDGTVTVNGTATDTAVFSVNANMVAEWSNYAQGDYVLNGSPTNQDTSKYKLRVFYASNDYIDTGSGVTWTFRGTSGITVFKTDIVVYSGTTMSNVLFKPMIRLSSETDATFAPYSNICPISGRTEVVTHRTGVNVWDEEWEVGSYNTTTGEPTTSGSTIRSKNSISVLPSTTYYIKNGGTGAIFVYWYDANDGFISYENVTNATIVAPNNAHYMRFRTQSAYGTTYNHDISINYPSTDHDYHAYDGTSYTTTLGQTVYGGTLDVVSGELTVDRAMVTLDGTQSFVSQGNLTNTKHYSYDAPNMSNSPSVYSADVISDKMPTIADNSDAIHINHRNVGIHIWIPSDKTPSVWFAENPTIVVYPIATPQTYQLTPQEVRLLLGTNNIWSDGNVTLVYSADIQRWVEKKLNGNSTTLTMSRPMVQTETETETETETTETEETE